MYNKNKLYKTLGLSLSRDVLNYDFLKNGLGMVSPSHFVYDFSREMFLILYSINWSIFVVWLSFLLGILGKMCIAIVFFPGLNAINFEIKLILLIQPFFYMTKMSIQKFEHLENKIRFQDEIKSIFHDF